MADISLVTADKVNVGTLTVLQYTGVAGEAITAGAPVYIDGTTGKFLNSDANGSGTVDVFGIAVRTVAAGQPLTVVRIGLVDGYDLAGLSYGAPVYLSNTVGRIADAAGSSDVRIGTVVPAFGQALGSSPDKVLLVERSIASQYL